MSGDQILIAVMAVFAVLGAADRILGNHLGLGLEFENGILAMGSLALAMVGIVCLAPVWAALVALVDALPILGTGTVLVPWSVVCFLQGDTPRALGILGIYITAAVTRSMLEPKLLGKHLGPAGDADGAVYRLPALGRRRHDSGSPAHRSRLATAAGSSRQSLKKIPSSYCASNSFLL